MTDLFLNRKPVAKGLRVGSGGEGDVFEIKGDPDRLIKIYTDGKGPERADKIRAMVRRRLDQRSGFAAFPQDIVTNGANDVAGFAMRRVRDHHPIHELYGVGSRKHHFPNADYLFLVRTARTLAAAVASVHDTGCVIGDINESGILVSRQASLSLVDCDSFQVRDGNDVYRCRVVKDEYRPPELATQRIENIVLNLNNDAFGLAVLIFQLLFLGRHPFSGTPQTGHVEIPQAIREYRFAYSLSRDVGMTPPKQALLLQEMPPEIAQAFEQAFAPLKTTPRPSAHEWVRKLEQLEKQLKPCPRHLRHYYPPHLSQCPFCRIEGPKYVPFVYAPRPAGKPPPPPPSPPPPPTNAAVGGAKNKGKSARNAKARIAMTVSLCAILVLVWPAPELANETHEPTPVPENGQPQEPPGQTEPPVTMDSAARIFRDCPECPEMVMIPAGAFLMGASKRARSADAANQGAARPQHRVTIPEPFAVSKFEVTRRQFAAFVNATGHDALRGGCTLRRATGWASDRSNAWHDPGFQQSDDHPVTCVSWDDAKAYVGWLSAKTGRRYRLLSEAEWEYAARAGMTGPFGFAGPISQQSANYGGTTATEPVDRYEPNAFGLHQTHGNVSEWVEDCWNADYAGKPQHLKRTAGAWTTGDCGRRVVRGGDWSTLPAKLRSSARRAMLHIRRFNVIGLRVARALRANELRR